MLSGSVVAPDDDLNIFQLFPSQLFFPRNRIVSERRIPRASWEHGVLNRAARMAKESCEANGDFQVAVQDSLTNNTAGIGTQSNINLWMCSF